MAQIKCNIENMRESIYTGDLVMHKGTIGLMCEYYNKDTNTEVYFIQSFEGKTLKHYGEVYSEVDRDTDTILLCRRDDLNINLSKKGEYNGKQISY